MCNFVALEFVYLNNYALIALVWPMGA
jgi:hypothetical protein